MKRHFRERQLVVYQKHKHGKRPGPRARDVRPAPRGETYQYVVDKYWVVIGTRERGRLLLRTPGGKLHEVDEDDVHLRRPTWSEWLRLWLSSRERLRALRQPQV
jgi:hypothetical protein